MADVSPLVPEWEELLIPESDEAEPLDADADEENMNVEDAS